MNHLPFKLTKKGYFKGRSLNTSLHLKNTLSAATSHNKRFYIHPYEILQMAPQAAQATDMNIVLLIVWQLY